MDLDFFPLFKVVLIFSASNFFLLKIRLPLIYSSLSVRISLVLLPRTEIFIELSTCFELNSKKWRDRGVGMICISEKKTRDPVLEQDLVSKAKREMFMCECNVSHASWTNKPTIIIRSGEQTAFKDVVSSVARAGTEVVIALAGST